MTQLLPGTLLIVDDEEELVSILRDLLTDVVQNIITANNGEQGLEALSKHKVDAVLSDIKMPKMDGVEFIKNARARGYNMPFMFYTAHGNRELMLEVVKYEVFDFLSKPNLEALEESVARAIQHSLDKKNEKVKGSNPNDPNFDIGNLLNQLDKKS